MKKAYTLLFLILACVTFKAQNNHATIQTVSVGYKISSAPVNISHIQAVPSLTVNLKANTGVTKIYFKISDKTSGNQIYQASYQINSAPVINNGSTLFQSLDNTCLLSYGQAVTVMPYKYEIWTEDGKNSLSSKFTLIQ